MQLQRDSKGRWVVKYNGVTFTPNYTGVVPSIEFAYNNYWGIDRHLPCQLIAGASGRFYHEDGTSDEPVRLSVKCEC